MKVLHVITGLERGGAESVMYRLCAESHGKACRHTVVSLTGRGVYAKAFEERGIEVICLDVRSAAGVARAVWKLAGLIRARDPDVIQTWMYHADLVGGIAARLVGRVPLVWGVRNSIAGKPVMKRSTRLVIRACAALSGRLPTKIIVCARNSVDEYANIGYRRDKMLVVQNGVDTRRFYSSKADGDAWRSANGFDRQLPLLGMIARSSPQKDHETLLRALGSLARDGEAFRCLLAGTGIDGSNRSLTSMIDELGLANHVILMGPRSDVPEIMRALDLHVLSSHVEGFPNVLAEAMASGTPCVGTDVGDASHIIGGYGWLVPAGNAPALAGALTSALSERRNAPDQWAQRGIDCEAHIRAHFGMQHMIDDYVAVWRSVQHG